MATGLNRWGFQSTYTPVNERQVVSLDEWQSPWTEKLRAFENREANPDPGASQRSNFNNMIVERFAGTPNVDHTNIGKIADAYWNSAVGSALAGGSPGANAFFSDPKTFDFNALVSATSDDRFDWAGYDAGMKAVADPFYENANRQATAYGQMQGGNFFGGLTNEGYTQGSASDGYSASQPGGTAMGLGQSTPQGWAGVGQPTAAGPLPSRQFTAGRVGGLGGLGGFNPESSWGGPFGGG